MDSYSSHPTLPLSSEEDHPLHYQQQLPLELIDFHHPFDIETRVEDTAEFLECCSMDYPSKLNSKIRVVSTRPPNRISEYSADCEMDGSYTEFVETQWTKGSSGSEGDSESAGSHMESIEAVPETKSESESVVVSAPLHGPSVKCVCVCNKKGCEFMNKPFDSHSIRESPVSRISVSYKLATWLKSLTPHKRTQSPSLDQVDACSKVHPEKRLKIIQLLRTRRPPKDQACHKKESKALSAIRKYIPRITVRKASVSTEASEEGLKSCEVSVPRTLAIMLGLSFILMGITYDHGVKHGVDNVLQDCWSWLRTSYMNFGDEFVSYNSIFFRMTNTDTLYGEPYPKYGPSNAKNSSSNLTQFQEAINNADPRFLFILEGLKLSVQLNFLSIDESSNMSNPRVLVTEKGPLFFRISFRRTVGLQIHYIPDRSNMTLSTPFQVYDLMKMILMSNDLPYFGLSAYDHLKTTPSALLTMIIDNLKKFKVDTTFLSGIKAQIEKSRIRRSTAPLTNDTSPTNSSLADESVTKNSTDVHNSTNAVTEKYKSEPPSPSQSLPSLSTTAAAFKSIEERAADSNQTSVMAALARIRRSTAEPTLVKASWKSLEEISTRIFLPLPLDTRKTVLLPVPFLRKNLTLKYRHQVNVLGLPGYQFILGNDMDKGNPSSHGRPDLYPSLSYSRVKDGEKTDTTSNPHIQRHRFNDRKKHHRHSKHQNFLENDSYRSIFNEVLGVVDLEPFLLETIGRPQIMGQRLENYPFWVSAPHFLSLANRLKHVNRSTAPPDTSTTKVSIVHSTGSLGMSSTTASTAASTTPTANNILVGVDGLAADESCHGSFIYYHPILGVPINASLAVQVGVRPPEGMLHAHKLVPILWVRAQVEEIPVTLWYILWAACHLRETIMVTLILIGMLIITCALTCGKSKESLERPASA